MCSVRPIELTASKSGLRHLAVVQEAHLGQVVEPLALDRLLRPQRLLLGQRDAERPHAVLAGGVAHHAAPAAADVEQPLAGLETELARDQVVLERLRLLQRRVGARVARAGVGHRRPEHELVEPVGDVVVVVDRLGVAGHRVPHALDHPAPAGQVLLRRRRRRLELGQAQPADHPQRVAHRRHPEVRVLLHQRDRGVRVAGVHAGDLEVAGDVGPGEPEVARRGQQVAQAALVAQVQPDGRAGRAGTAPVVRREAHREAALDQPVDHLADRHVGRRRRADAAGCW